MAQHSFSKIKAFESCPRKYYETQVLKKWPREETQATLYGTELHKHAEDFIVAGTPVPSSFKFIQPSLDSIMNMPGRKHAELEMALTESLSPCDFKAPNFWVRGIADVVVLDDDNLSARVFDWKGLAVDTPIPTPTGFTTMGALQVGDTLFDRRGEVCTVTGKSDVKNIDCYRVTFSDTSSVVCDAEHLWQTLAGDVVGVTQLRGAGGKKGGTKIPLAAPLQLRHADLPIDPYVLGLWLADGKHSSGEVSKPDPDIWAEVQRRGYPVDMRTGGNGSCPTRTVQGLAKQLRLSGLLRNKHIPRAYLRASAQQRVDLLRGLMDGDGNYNKPRKTCVFTNTNPELVKDVHELLCSLGQRPCTSPIKATGFGKTVAAFFVAFTPQGLNPFYLPRKAEQVDVLRKGRSWYRRVRSVVKIDSVPTQCIKVSSEDHTFLCTRDMIVTHNTGGNKYPDTDQLMLMSLMILKHNPHIRSVSGGLIFVLKGTVAKYKMHRDDEFALWWKWRERVAKLDAAHHHNNWPAKPNGLCRQYCEVLDCPHNGRRK